MSHSKQQKHSKLLAESHFGWSVYIRRTLW